jgi:hypothetical protein
MTERKGFLLMSFVRPSILAALLAATIWAVGEWGEKEASVVLHFDPTACHTEDTVKAHHFRLELAEVGDQFCIKFSQFPRSLHGRDSLMQRTFERLASANPKLKVNPYMLNAMAHDSSSFYIIFRLASPLPKRPEIRLTLKPQHYVLGLFISLLTTSLSLC